jgi:hypothetical protein
MLVAGTGTGIAMATAMSAALVELSEEKSGVGAAVLQAVNKTGGARHRHSRQRAQRRLPRPPRPVGLSATSAAAARQSVFGGVALTHKTRSTALLRSVDSASVHDMEMALLVCAGTAVVGAVLTVVFLPKVNLPPPARRPV